METKGTTGEETTSYWFDLPIDVAEFEEKLGVGAESQDYRIIEKVLPFADEVHEHTSVYQLNELDFMYRQLSSDMQEEYTALLTVYENLEALYICRNVITVYSDCKSMIDVATELKKRKANRIFVVATFGLFTNGLEKFDKAVEDGTIYRVVTTNLTYQTPELLSRPYYINCDMSKYIAYIIDTLNHDASISELLDPNERIQKLIKKYKANQKKK